MPRYKDSPEVRAAKKERKEKFREILSSLDVEDMSDLRSIFKRWSERFSKTDLKQSLMMNSATRGMTIATRIPRIAATVTAGKR